MAHVYTSDEGPGRSSAASTGSIGVDPRSRAVLAGLPARRARVLGRRHRCSSTRCSALQAVLPYSLGLPAVPEDLVVQHGGLVRHQHELAVVLARPHAGLHRAARRPRRAELRVGRRRHRRRDRPRARLRAPQVGHDRQLLGRPVPRHRSASCCRSRVVAAIVLIAGGVIQNFNGFTGGHDARRRHAEPARRPGRLAGGDQGARHERRRVLQRELRAPVREPDRRGRTSSRSCSCSRSRSRCRAPSAGWSATTARATRSSRPWPSLFVDLARRR